MRTRLWDGVAQTRGTSGGINEDRTTKWFQALKNYLRYSKVARKEKTIGWTVINVD